MASEIIKWSKQIRASAYFLNLGNYSPYKKSVKSPVGPRPKKMKPSAGEVTFHGPPQVN